MIPNFFHYILLIILLQTFYFDVMKQGHHYQRTFKVMVVLLGIISAIRYGVGIDTPNYMYAHSYIPKLTDLQPMHFIMFRYQPLYIIFSSFCKQITENYCIVNILQAALFYPSLYYALKWINIRRFYVLLMFYFGLYIGLLSCAREIMALSFCFYSIYYYQRRNWKMYFLFVAIAYGFHSGGLIFALLPLCRLSIFENNAKRGFQLMLIFCLVAFSVMHLIFGQLAALQFGDGSIARYAAHAQESMGGERNYLNLLKNLLLVGLVYMYCIKRKAANVQIEYIIPGVVFIITDTLSGFFGFGIFYRFTTYLFVFYSYLICSLLSNVKRETTTLLLSFFIAFYQPIQRYHTLFNDDFGIDSYGSYCTIFSSNKSHFNRLINNSYAEDYLLFQ